MDHRTKTSQEGYLSTVSDLMAALLFIFLITLTTFVLTFQSTVEELAKLQDLRAELLREIEKQLETHFNLHVQVDEDHGLLRLTEQAISFPSGSAELGLAERGKLRHLQAVFAEILPCYSGNLHDETRCPSQHRGKLESVLVEGHTDNQPMHSKDFANNFELSAARALAVYQTVVNRQNAEGQALQAMQNLAGQPIFGVAGYGPGRPVHWHAEPTSDAANRRIDLRFLMTSPGTALAERPTENLIESLQREGLR